MFPGEHSSIGVLFVVLVAAITLVRTMTLVALVLSMSLGAAHAGTRTDDPQNGTVRWVVHLDRAAPVPEAGTSWHGAEVVRASPRLDSFVVLADAGYAARVDSAEIREIVPDPVMSLHATTPDDTWWPYQHGPRAVTADDAWDVGLGTDAIDVCIIDTGGQPYHEDLRGTEWKAAWDHGQDDASATDSSGHGTHVMGIAMATSDNGVGIAGIAQAGIMVAKVSGSDGLIRQSDAADAILWCVDNGAEVINISLGNDSYIAAALEAQRYAARKGVLVVASAGNKGCSDCVEYPAKFEEVVAVGCTGYQDARCAFSARGPEVELVAPGADIVSTCHTSSRSYCYKSGTSMSSPHVAGVAALVWSRAPDLRADTVRALLVGNAKDLGAAGRDDAYGHGLVDAFAAQGAVGVQHPQVEVARWDFDSGVAPDWSLSGYWRVDGECAGSASGAYHIGYNRPITCDHQWILGNTGAASVKVDLTGATQATLSFQHRWSLPPEPAAFDSFRVEARALGGEWIPLEAWDAMDPVPSGYVEARYRMDEVAGGVAELRFTYEAVGPLGTGFGWLVDDVVVLAGGP